MVFQPKKHIIKVDGGRQYLPVAPRVQWFREEHSDWSISTEIVHLDFETQVCVCKTSILNEHGTVIATGHGFESQKTFPDWIEKSETASVGRALALAGYGTEFALDLAEHTNGGVLFNQGDYVCDECLKVITVNQRTLSVGKFNRPLCPQCQKYVHSHKVA